MYNKIGGKFVPKGKGPFLMKAFSGFGNDSPAKHDDRDLQRDLRRRRRIQIKSRIGVKPDGYSGFGPSRTFSSMAGAFDRGNDNSLSFAERVSGRKS